MHQDMPSEKYYINDKKTISGDPLLIYQKP